MVGPTSLARQIQDQFPHSDPVDDTLSAVQRWPLKVTSAIDRAADGLWLDFLLYVLSGAFAYYTLTQSTLLSHRAWGRVAIYAYAAGAAVVLIQLMLRAAGAGGGWRAPARTLVTWVVYAGCALTPLVWQAMDRAAGRTDRAQEEVQVIEAGGSRLLETASPYLSRAAIAALPASDRLLAYLPYQPAMAIFGLPRAVDPGHHWWSDARIGFAAVTVVVLLIAVRALARAGAAAHGLVRALQAATVLPLCALTLATGGDDLPVLALCLLGIALAATRRFGRAGIALGLAGSLKLFAWPVALVVGALAYNRARGIRYAVAAFGLPLVTAASALRVDAFGLAENVLAFPFGHGLVSSPANSPLPGHLIATAIPQGPAIAAALLLAAAVTITVLLSRRPPHTATSAALFSGLGMLAAVLLLPSSRFGYLLYPAVILVWASVLRLPKDDILGSLDQYSRPYQRNEVRFSPLELTAGPAPVNGPNHNQEPVRPAYDPPTSDQPTVDWRIFDRPAPPAAHELNRPGESWPS
jgi:Glycosyltransferase family 87